MLPAMTGDGIVSWIHIDDVATATADALDRGRGGKMYNIVDDRPQSFGDCVRELADLAPARRTTGLVPGDRVRHDPAADVECEGESRSRLASC
jgi:nucleoside-diphosphate-sugar epimerase